MKTKSVSCAYLYADGHAVLVYEKRDADAGTIKFVEIHEKFTEAKLFFKGRIVLGGYGKEGILKLIPQAIRIEADAQESSHGSENTRRLGIKVGGLDVILKGEARLHFVSLDVISAPYTYQPEHEEKFNPSLGTWGDCNVAKIHRVETKGEA